MPSVAQIQQIVDRSPFNQWLRLRVTSLDAQSVELTLITRAELMGNAGLGALHGGVLSSLVDVAGSVAVLAQTDRSLVTVDLRADFHRPAVDSELTITGSVVKLGRQLATSDVRIYDRQRKLIASGRIVAMHTDTVPMAPAQFLSSAR